MKKKKSEETPLSGTDETMRLLNKEFGEGTVMRMTDVVQTYDGVLTPSKALNDAIGGYGLPKGKIIEIMGAESSSKTTLCLQTIAMAQKDGMNCAYIDAEHAMNVSWAKRLGVDMDRLCLSQPGWGEQGLKIAEMFIKDKGTSIVVIDSVASLTPKTELEGQAGDQHVGLLARMMGQAMRRLTGAISESKTCVIFINQQRDTIGKFGYGPKWTTPGGRALKFYASVRIELARIKTLKSGNKPSHGIQVKAKVIKNKCAPPYRECEYQLLYETGIRDIKESEKVNKNTEIKKGGQDDD